jgi:hypothetical protein
MKSLIFGAIFFVSIHYGWAQELIVMEKDIVENVNKVNFQVPSVGRAPACPTCAVDESEAFVKLNAENSSFCQSIFAKRYYEIVNSCSSENKAEEFLLFRFIRKFSTAPDRERKIELHSTQNALNDTYLSISDTSSKVVSTIFILPRRVLPSVLEDEETLKVTLPTGEQVIMDKNTRKILTGAMTEAGPAYSGTGISIRLEAEGEPQKKAESAVIKQGDKTCTIPRTKLFSNEGRLASNSDSELHRTIKLACPGILFTL